MAAERMTLHLDPVCAADNLIIMLDVLARSPDVRHADYASISRRIREDYDFTDRTEPLWLARSLGLLAVDDKGMTLSAAGRTIAGMRPATRADALHFLLLTAWDGDGDPTLARSWVYRRFCDRLWSHGTVDLHSAETKRIVADLLDDAQQAFAGLRRAALSPKSVLGMRRWLDALEPRVLDDDRFRRRDVCSAELLLLAIGQTAREDGASLGADLLLTPARRDAICRICLLEPAALDRAVDRAMPAFPHLIEPGTRTGAYGRFVRLKAMPSIETFADRQ